MIKKIYKYVIIVKDKKMTIESFDIVFYTSIFILPGFIIKGIINVLTPPQKSGESVYFISCLAYSIINCALWSWIYKILYPLHESNSNLYWILLVLTTIVGALVIALCVGFIKQRQLINKIFNKIHIHYIDPTPTAWDYYFAKQEPIWVIVTLLDDSKVMGLFSESSFASSDSDERDIYIQEIYDIDEKKKWIKNENSCGIYISKNQIKTIEFLKS